MRGLQSLEGCTRRAARLQAIGGGGLRRVDCGIGCTLRLVVASLFGRVLPHSPRVAAIESGTRSGVWSGETASDGRARRVSLGRGRTRQTPSPTGRGEASSIREKGQLTPHLPITSQRVRRAVPLMRGREDGAIVVRAAIGR